MPAGGGFEFGPFVLDTGERRLRRDDVPVDLSALQYALLLELVSNPDKPVSKNRLIEAAWKGDAVGDSSIEKLTFQLRMRLDPDARYRYIETVHRQGYKFIVPVKTIVPDVYARIAPLRAWTEGRAALETLVGDRLPEAQRTFQELVRTHPNEALFHVGLANTYLLQFETTRAGVAPNVEARRLAIFHAHEACRVGPNLIKAIATLGFVLGTLGDREKGLAALNTAVIEEPDRWLHLFRLAAIAWGEERLYAARRTLGQFAHFPMAHVLVATVLIARGLLAEAERELDEAVKVLTGRANKPSRFSAVAVYWLKGLLCLARGADDEAMEAFRCELALASLGHLYARECCGNTWYAIGAMHLRRGDTTAALTAFQECLTRVPRHPQAHAGLAILGQAVADIPTEIDQEVSVDIAMARAAVLAVRGDHAAAARVVLPALEGATKGNAGWLIPIDPLLAVYTAPDAWAIVRQELCERAS